MSDIKDTTMHGSHTPEPKGSPVHEQPTLAAATTLDRVEAPVTFKAYLMCAFASFGGIFFG